MIIKNQNASQLLLRSICRRQAPRLLDDENPSRAPAWLFARSRQAIQAGAGGGPDESPWERDRLMAKVFPFHALTLWRSHLAAMARAEDLLLIPMESLRFPLLMERTNRNRD